VSRLNVRLLVWNQSDWLDVSRLRNRLALNQSAALDGNHHRYAVQNDCHPSGIQNDRLSGYPDASRNVRQDDHRSGYQDVRHHHQSLAWLVAQGLESRKQQCLAG
jgi:hypothetical protein